MFGRADGVRMILSPGRGTSSSINHYAERVHDLILYQYLSDSADPLSPHGVVYSARNCKIHLRCAR